MNETLSTSFRVASALLGLGFVALIVWAFGKADFFASFSVIAADPWGLVSLADLYLGFFLFAVVIAMFDGLRLSTTIWLVLLFSLGNAVAAAWLVWRWRSLSGRLRN